LELSNKIGITGLIYANCINMGLRIASSLHFAFKMEEENPKGRMKTFLRDYLTIDVAFIVGLVK
jgi:hypothetical protein